MTINDIITVVDKLRPGSAMTIDEYLSCLNRLEEDIYKNIISCHERQLEFKKHTVETDILQVPDMYAELYKYYLLAQIDIANGDITRYSNNMILYNNLLSAFFDYCIRNNMPKQKGKVRWK